jgi:hypothetical protein
MGSPDVVAIRGGGPAPLAHALALTLACTALKPLRGGALMADTLVDASARGIDALRTAADRAHWWCDGYADASGTRSDEQWMRAWDALTRLLEVLA